MSRQQLAGWDVTVPDREGAVAGEPPRLSVMITYYKGEDMVADAVRSALAQTVPPHEIVICDDGSPDDLDAGLGELREHVKIVRKENGGTGSALNAAAGAASGDYVVQLDVDDVFEPRRLEAISAVLTQRPDVDMLGTDAVIEYEGAALCELSEIDPFPETDEREGMLHDLHRSVARGAALAGARGGRLGREPESDRGLGLLAAARARRGRRGLRPRAALPLAADAQAAAPRATASRTSPTRCA